MDLFVEKSDLLKELNFVRSAVEKRNTIPILSHFLLEAEGLELKITATKSWGPTLTESVGTEVDYQVAAPLKREHPTCTERISLTKECGWKDGDRGGLAESEQTHGKKKAKVCIDINRPSHGRTYRGPEDRRSNSG